MSIMSDESLAFSIELKSRKFLNSLTIDCDHRMKGIFIEGFLGELVDIKLVDGTLLEISGTHGAFYLDIKYQELHRALTRRPQQPVRSDGVV